jgi:hypothetical protein
MTDIGERLCRTLSDLPGDDDDLFHEIHSQREEAAKEIKRLRAGGCARPQTTTQFCAEAVELREQNDWLLQWLLAIAEHPVEKSGKWKNGAKEMIRCARVALREHEKTKMTFNTLEYKLKGPSLLRRGEEVRSDDITEQLRRVPRVADSERLRAENERLLKSLEHYACRCADDACEAGNRGDVSCGHTARAALAEEKTK